MSHVKQNRHHRGASHAISQWQKKMGYDCPQTDIDYAGADAGRLTANYDRCKCKFLLEDKAKGETGVLDLHKIVKLSQRRLSKEDTPGFANWMARLDLAERAKLPLFERVYETRDDEVTRTQWLPVNEAAAAIWLENPKLHGWMSYEDEREVQLWIRSIVQ